MERAAEPAQVVVSIEDLLSKILSLLPIKDLLRFRSVSKHWRALISDPNFCHLRSPNPNPAAAGVFLPPAGIHDLNEYVPFSALNSRTFQFNLSHPISQSCNGLLLVESDFSCLVYNATTNCCFELPEPVGGWGSLRFFTLAFDPLKSRHYNVVCIRVPEPDDNQLMLLMYSSETRSWGVCVQPFPPTVDFVKGVYWNGAVHWLGVERNEGGLYFQVEHKVLEKMPIMPFRHEGYGCRHYFGHSCDHLHLIENHVFGNPYDVYEMKRDYSEWFFKYRVDLGPVIAANPEMVSNYGNLERRFFCVLNVIRGEAEEDSFLLVMTPHRIIRYNLVSETFENFYEFENRRNPEERGVEFIESLCCV